MLRSSLCYDVGQISLAKTALHLRVTDTEQSSIEYTVIKRQQLNVAYSLISLSSHLRQYLPISNNTN